MVADVVSPADDSTRTKIIMLALRRALLLIVATIEQCYGLDPKDRVTIIIEK